VQLAHDDTLGTVDDEGTVLGHERDLAEVDLLLLDVANGALRALTRAVVDDQLDRDLDRRRERHAALHALIDVVLGTLEGVADEDELARAVEVADREDAAEDPLEADVLALVLRDVRLEELLVRPLLDVDQVRDRDDLLDLPEAVTNAEVGLNHRGHRRVPLSRAVDAAARDLVGGLKQTKQGKSKVRRNETTDRGEKASRPSHRDPRKLSSELGR
jgi:hypothetical protein